MRLYIDLEATASLAFKELFIGDVLLYNVVVSEIGTLMHIIIHHRYNSIHDWLKKVICDGKKMLCIRLMIKKLSPVGAFVFRQLSELEVFRTTSM